MDASTKPEALELLRVAVDDAHAEFRAGQWEAIERIVQSQGRALLVQRTGWGKSLVYFIATKLLRRKGSGPTLLISPLLALMRNQLLAAERVGIRAIRIDSSNRTKWPEYEAAALGDDADILLISPERLANEGFREQLFVPLVEKLSMGLLVVDEAHCISDWGHDFRPDYRRIRRILQSLPPRTPVLLTTATANDRVVEDIREQIGEELEIVRGTLERESLCLQTVRLPSRAERLAWLAAHLDSLPGSGIIYVLTTRDACRVSGWLETCGLRTAAYWGGLDTERREALESALLKNEVKALVATSALGMGFDKPDLGFVIHYQRPQSVIHYYQQVGRAGRAIPEAYGILLRGAEDDDVANHFIDSAFPPVETVDAVLAALGRAETGLTQWGLEREVNVPHGLLEKVLKFLAVESPAPVAREKKRWVRTPVRYERDQERIDRLTTLRRQEQNQMEDFLHTGDCLMRFLRRALDDPQASRCGRCATCQGRELFASTAPQPLVRRAIEYLGRQDESIAPRKKWRGDALDTYGWRGKIPENLRASEGRALCFWGDPGLGQLVREGKQERSAFAPELVAACRELVTKRWRPEPRPTWVAYVPSLRHATLVEGFAQQLADELGLPCLACFTKRKETAPQKTMQNAYQQARNLDGAFEIDTDQVRAEPVMLVDDVVDSRWTMTVLTALLRQAGSGPVYPLALASAARRSSG